VKRIGENMIVAMTSAVVVWLLDHPGKSQSAVRATANAIGRFGNGLRTPVLALAVVSASLALMLLVTGWRRQAIDGSSFWEFELHLPSAPTSLLGVGAVLLLVWVGFGACASGHVWGLVPTAAAAWTCVRFADRVRRAWAYPSGLL
jgi:hypothetical protein